MKFRYIVLCWIVLLGVGLIPLFMKTGRRTRDMVYYNSQVNAIADGGAVPEGCEVIWVSDSDYLARQNTYLKNGALVMDIIQDGVIKGKAVWNDAEEAASETERSTMAKMLTVWGIAAVSGSALLIFIYAKYIRPFKRLGKFAGEVARGNLDFPLGVGRNDFFGAFTESFDIMREELKNARAKEAEMQKAKQEMLAELSHDIRTPLATISATCEVLEVKNPSPDVISKTEVIRAKAATIDSLISNMMSASLEEVSELRVDASDNPSVMIGDMIDNLKAAGSINEIGEVPGCLLYFDPLRMEQVIDNIVGNSLKYAGTEVTVEYLKKDNGIIIKISDKGPGVPEEELSLLTQKFYRGQGSSGHPGSGLGLYLADYFMKKMEGAIEFYNASEGGFVAEIFVRKA